MPAFRRTADAMPLGRETAPNRIGRLVIVEDYSNARGGATTLALACARGARAAGIPVVYICGDRGENDALRADGIEVVALGRDDLLHASALRAFTDGIHNVAGRRFLEDWIARFDDSGTVYHVHGWSKIWSPAVFAALKPVAHRTIVHAHDFFAACPNGAFYDYQRGETCFLRPLSAACLSTQCDKRNYAQKLWRVARGANVAHHLAHQPDFARIVLLHPAMAPFFERAGYDPARLTTIRNPAAAYTKERVRAERNGEFVFVGRLDEEKGIEDVLDATERAGVRLRVIGDGPLMARVRASTADVVAEGWLDHAGIARAIASARALVMGSRYPEPFGMVALEAAGSGLPVILPQSAFLAPEMVEGGFALSCDTRDVAAFADTLRTFADRPAAEVRGMSERAHALAPSLSLGADAWVAALIAQYRGALDRPSQQARARLRAPSLADAS